MRRISVDKIKSGEKTAGEVYADGTTLLAGAGYKLSGKNLDRIDELGILWVYMDDPRTEGLEPTGTISDDVKRANKAKVQHAFEAIAAEYATDLPISAQQRLESIEEQKGISADIFNELESVAKSTLDNILLGSSRMFVPLPQEEREGYLAHHGLEVLAGCVMMARKLSLDSKEMAAIAIGGMLHNTGMLFLPDEIISGEGELSDDQIKYMQYHPVFGYEYLRKNPRVGILTAHMAYQHHENQDGSGYPRGLCGTNKIPRRKEPISTRPQVHRYAEICAIVDTFVALGSPRPYRQAMPTDRALDVIMRMAGSKLNLEMVKAFLSITPRYPVGSEVMIMNGEFSGYHAIVWEVSQQELNRPLIKILNDPDFSSVEESIFIDLSVQPFIQLQGLI
ncbi:HD-GYP domain-containing protein [Desulfurispira natronophila]|uniref:HD-GYP domain-containing protein (C-di-GMP phosphodiesterase class II) n=1 Tax=Desulfurispira natronophila TaxID=682562 RepID=A0A7W7Y501_9BACT|nr:HD domain-containing phosphohydrolase [Desulfurispira natronophila]MBB5022198.1 HD-GYP domain-containing protein (c-di-GMP phosphodiesterase class II) [Desulfurispira natronophila]